MKASTSNLCLFLSFLSLQFYISCQSPDLENKDLLLYVKSLLEENRHLRESIRNLEEKFEEKSEKFEKKYEELSGLVTLGTARNSNPMARTCHELTSSDPTLGSGMYYIDPDGWNAGDAPIYVYCDKATGETRVVHDSLEKTNVGHCFDPGCYSRAVKYAASMRQIRALLELSPTCDQYIRYDCVNAVFEFNNVPYSWWDDRQGEPKYYWDGNNNTHTCSCGINGGCVESTVRCNCDAAASVSLYDEGFITDKDHLPITRLNFGRTSVSASLGEHTLGPLRCLGSFQSSANEIPTSCADLWRSGETVSGLYQVKPNGGPIVTVFCDMSKLPDETGHQTLIGTNDVKSNLIYFTVSLYGSHTSPGSLTLIPFDYEIVNIGNAMNLQTHKFNAPVNGIYFFSLTISSRSKASAFIMRALPPNAGRSYMEVMVNSDGNDYQVASAQATIELNAGDSVYAYLEEGTVESPYGKTTYLTGYLLQEL